MYTWPPHFPEHCPPNDASEVSGQIFRLVSKDGPKKFDFQSHYEREPSGGRTGSECNARGLSVLRTYKDCEILLSAIPALRKKLIAKAILDVGAGLIKQTPSNNCQGHHTWWRNITIEEACTLFAAYKPTEGEA